MAYDPSRLGVARIDLSGLPAPSAIEAYDQPTLISDWLTDFTERDPAYTVLLESQPAIKLNETGAYREFIQRQRVNDALKALLLLKSYGSNLDNLGARFGCYRLVISPENDSTSPVTPAVYEDDDDYRIRISYAPDAWSGAGPEGAYIYQASTADGRVKDVKVYGHPVVSPGTILVLVLADNTSDAPSVVKNVYARLMLKNIKPLTDNIQVRAATPVPYAVSAILHVGRGPDPALVQSEALASLYRYAALRRKIAKRIPVSGIDGALNLSMVDYVELLAPTEDLVPDYLSYGDIGSVSVSVAVDR